VQYFYLHSSAFQHYVFDLFLNKASDCEDDFVIYTSFTPNGDGLNDDYRLDGAIGQCEEGEIFIYNRWGQLIFESKSINFRWNGRDQLGIEMVEGVYYYLLKTKKKTETEWKDAHGTITLIK
jgi:gliding motility-associated-like protein